MKDQYFGDKTDYIKHSLLSELTKSSFRLAVHWNRTPDDDSTDGNKVTYLRDSLNWRHFDPRIFDAIATSIRNGDRRLRLFEELGFITESIFCYDLWKNTSEERHKSVDNLLNRIDNSFLVFLDPDNGLEVPSVNHNSKNSRKYVYFSELRKFWNNGNQFLIYQHYPRAPRTEYLTKRFIEIRERLKQVGTIFALSTSHAAFIFVTKQEKGAPLYSTLKRFSEKWNPHVLLFTSDETGSQFPISLENHPNDKQMGLPF